MIWRVILATAGLVAVLVVVHRWRLLKRRQELYQRAIELWRATPPDERTDALDRMTQACPANAAAWYLRACAELAADRPREAARGFGAAHHADCDLESAALATFASLKVGEHEGGDLISQIVETWKEMNRPPLMRKAVDRALLDGLLSTSRDAPPLSPLGRLIWAIGGPARQQEIERRVADPGDALGAALRSDQATSSAT
jgi:hypothetical protein